MDATISKLLSDLAAENKSLLLGPSENAGKKGERQSLEALVDVVVAPGTNFFVVSILWPGVQRPFEVSPLDVDEAGLSNPLLKIIGLNHWTTGSCASLLKQPAVACNVAVFCQCTIVRAIGQADLLEFYVTAGFEVTNRGVSVSLRGWSG